MQNAVQSRDCAAVAMDFLLCVLEIQILLFLALLCSQGLFTSKTSLQKRELKADSDGKCEEKKSGRRVTS